jgi:hypothetical protein
MNAILAMKPREEEEAVLLMLSISQALHQDYLIKQ